MKIESLPIPKESLYSYSDILYQKQHTILHLSEKKALLKHLNVNRLEPD